MALKPVEIPVAILNLTDATLSEKLLLALIAASTDGKYKPACRALGISKAGLRKLTARLAEKRLLTETNGHRLIHIPGFVYKLPPAGGSFVSSSEGAIIQKKVAPRQVLAETALDASPLTIPAELLDFKYLTASAKMLLAVYVTNPGATNSQVINLLGISLSGLKKIKRALLARHVLVAAANGYTVRLPGLLLVEGHFLSEAEAVQNGHKVPPTPRLIPARIIAKELDRALLQLRHRRDTIPSQLFDRVGRALQLIESQSPEGPEREAILKKVRDMENFYFAWTYVFENVPRVHELQCTKLIFNATPDQLAVFRERAEGLKLAGNAPKKLLRFFNDASHVDDGTNKAA
jgi:hypothetical protein